MRAICRGFKAFSGHCRRQPTANDGELIRRASRTSFPYVRSKPELFAKVIGKLDQLEKLRDGKTFLAEMEQRERARTGIKSLRVGYNKVFGHFIEVTRPNLHLVLADYTRKQTLAASERFVTLELKEFESLVVNAQERIAELEASLFRRVCTEIGKSREEILTAAGTIAYLDATASLAEWPKSLTTRPSIVDSLS